MLPFLAKFFYIFFIVSIYQEYPMIDFRSWSYIINFGLNQIHIPLDVADHYSLTLKFYSFLTSQKSLKIVASKTLPARFYTRWIHLGKCTITWLFLSQPWFTLNRVYFSIEILYFTLFVEIKYVRYCYICSVLWKLGWVLW